MELDEIDEQLLALLTANSRQSVTELARQLGVSRATTQERMRRLEQRQVIQSYTIRLHPAYLKRRVSALVLIAADQKRSAPLTRQLQRLGAVKALHSISGQYDFAALVQEETTDQLDREIDHIGQLEGVQRTMTSVMLSTKFER